MRKAGRSQSASAPAKVNLYLHVGPVKPNGRHDLDSLVVFADAAAADHLRVEPSETLGLEIEGPTGSQAGPIADNLVLKAARALQDTSGCRKGAFIRLRKTLPVAAGIGGGSSDAAATLRLLTEMWGIDPAHAEAAAPGLGGDVPVALAGRPALMRGEGERVTPLAVLPQLAALLVNPGAACPTGPVFHAYDEAGGGAGFAEIGVPSSFADAKALADWLAAQRNDLEAPAIRLVPEISAVLDFLRAQPGAWLARMSGSGATCFALFDTPAQAGRAAAALKREPGKAHWWFASCQLGAAP